MKRILRLSMVFIAVFAFALCISACQKTEHEHSFGEWTVTKAATCIESGEKERVCSECGKTEKEVIDVDKDAHKWGDRLPNGDGTHDRTCVLCEKDEPAVECDYVENIVPATCTEDGYIEHECRFCGYKPERTVIKASEHNYENSPWIPDPNNPGKHYRICLNDPNNVDHYEVGDCSAHSVEEKAEADCENDGFLRHVCSECGYVIDSSVTEKFGHDFTGEGSYVEQSHGSRYHVLHCAHDPDHTINAECDFDEVVHNADCTHEGYTVYTCSVCKDSYESEHTPTTDHSLGEDYHIDPDGGHYRTCSICETKVKEDCTYGEGAHTLPSCTADGYVTYTCIYCGSTKTETDVGSKLTHTYTIFHNNGNGTHDEECLYCGDKKRNIKCDLVEGETVLSTCTEYGYISYSCSKCNYVKQEQQALKPHSYDRWTSANDGTHTRTCSECNNVETMSCDYDEGEVKKPTCTEKGNTKFTCNTCGHIKYDNEQPAIGHTYPNKWLPVNDYSTSLRKHYRLCETCGVREEEQCSGFSEHTFDSTCFAAGRKDSTCDSCGGTVITETYELLPHTYGQYIADGEVGHYRECTAEGCDHKETAIHTMKSGKDLPTCNGVGTNFEMCEQCGYRSDGEDIPALGHTFEDSWTYDGNGHHYRECTVCRNYREENDCVIDTVTTDATCTKATVKTHTCSVCGNSATETVGYALGHDYGQWVPVGNDEHTKTCLRENCDDKAHNSVTEHCRFVQSSVSPTCTTAGKYVYTCSDCHFVKDGETIPAIPHKYPEKWTSDGDGHHFRICEYGCETTESKDCSYSEQKTLPSCTEQGYTVFTCNDCEYTYKGDIVAAKGHNFGDYQMSENGVDHIRKCNDCTETESGKCEFDVRTVSGDCSTPGAKIYTCKHCKYERTESLPITAEHQWTLSAKSTDNSQHTMQCTVCHTTQLFDCEYDVEEHAPTCTSKGYHVHTCAICKNVYRHDEGEMLPHSYGQWTFNGEAEHTHTRNCLNCGYSETSDCKKENGTVTEGNCTTNTIVTYTCDDCGGTFSEVTVHAQGHKWGYSQIVTGQRYHTYTCLICRETRNSDCVYNEKIKNATCTSDGSKTLQCVVCANMLTEKIPALGHDFGENDWISDKSGHHYHVCRRDGCEQSESRNCVLIDVSKAPTCQEGGKTGKICTDCGYGVGVGDVAQLVHDMTQWAHTIKDGVHYHVRHCQRANCGHVEEEKCNLTIERTPFTCTSPETETETCGVCNYTNTVILTDVLEQGHQWTVDHKDDSSHRSVCTRCGASSETTHTFTTSNICDGCDYDGLEYKLINGSYYQVFSDNRVLNATTVVVPEFIDNYPVKEIARYAFYNNKNLETIILPSSIKTICEMSFAHCVNLKTVKFSGESDIELEIIERSAFYDDEKLRDVPFDRFTKLTTVGADCFYDCSALNDIVIYDTLTHIGGEAFMKTGYYNDRSHWEDNGTVLYMGHHLIKVDNSKSGSFEIRESAVSVGEAAFDGCANITDLVIHSNMKYMDNNAFRNCSTLRTVEYKGSLAQWLSISFGNDLSSPLHIAQSFHIAEAKDDPQIPTDGSVTNIPAGTFRNNPELKNVTIPDNITSIGAYAFYGCENLTNITIPDSVTSIGEHAFDGCTALFDISENWENGVYYIGNHLIKGDNDRIVSGVEGGKVTIKSTTVTISPRAFYGCTALTEINIPRSVVWIGEQAFIGSGLKRAVFENASSEKNNTSTQFFATNYPMVMGRWEDTALADSVYSANLLLRIYGGYWKRTRGGNA